MTSRKPPPNPRGRIGPRFHILPFQIIGVFCMCTYFAFILKEKLLSSRDRLKCAAHWESALFPLGLFPLEVDIHYKLLTWQLADQMSVP